MKHIQFSGEIVSRVDVISLKIIIAEYNRKASTKLQ